MKIKVLALFLALCAIFTSMFIVPAEAANSYARIKLWKSATVTANGGLNARSGPGTGYPIVKTLAKGANINVANIPVSADGYDWVCVPELNNAWVVTRYLNINGNSGSEYISGTFKIKASYCDKYISYVNETDGANIVLYDDLAGTDLEKLQYFTFTPIGYFSDCGTVWYRITPAVNANYSLDQDVNDYTQTQLWSTHDGENQQWILEVTSNLTVKIINLQTRYVLDVNGGTVTNNNTDIISYPWHGGDNQRWVLVDPYQVRKQDTYTYNGTEFVVVPNFRSEFFYNQNNYNRFVNSKGNRGCTATAMCIAWAIYHNKALSPQYVKWSAEGTSWEYCDTYTEGKTRYEGEKYTQEQALRCAYNSVMNGCPMILGVIKSNSRHVVTVTGVRAGADVSNLSLSDLLIVDPNGGKVCTLATYAGVDCWWNLRVPTN